MAEQSMTKCWTCKKACGRGGCPWTERDKKTGKVKFQPVEGWDVIETKVLMNSHGGARRHYETSYFVKDCPLCVEDKR